MNLENKCPDFEELSNWHDNESDKDYTQHVASCDDCQSVIEDFKKIDSGLSNILSGAQPSADFKDKLLTNKPVQKEPVKFISHILKLVAILTTAFILNYLATKQDNIKSGDSVAEQQAVTDKHTVPVMTAHNETPAAPISESLKSEIPKQDFQLVGLNPQQDETTKLELKSSIKHVWLAADVNKAAEKLTKELQKFAVVTKNFDTAGSFHITVQLSEKDLIKKVNRLAESGMSLVSRELPQPNSNFTSLTPEKQITYNISIIKKK